MPQILKLLQYPVFHRIVFVDADLGNDSVRFVRIVRLCKVRSMFL